MGFELLVRQFFSKSLLYDIFLYIAYIILEKKNQESDEPGMKDQLF